MSSKGWYSKQDVLKDLVEVTGKCFHDFGKHYVVGENPPPVWRTNEDEEDVTRFYGGQRPMQSDNIEKPDLAGITQMLRMVDNYYDSPNDLSTSNKEQMITKSTESEPANIIVSISKLNPNVTEFVPQKSVSYSSIDVKNNSENKIYEVTKDVSVSNMVDVKETVKTDCCDTVKTNVNGNRINISQLLSNELKEMRDQLKTKICDTSKVKCVKLRRERNLAIATLLKLYCQQPADEKKPNLISPDYFKYNTANKNNVTEQNMKTDRDNSINVHLSDNNLNASTDDDSIRKEIAASVEKVTRWLHSSEPDTISDNITDIKEPTPNFPEIEVTTKKPTKGPLLHLGPVTFKRKTKSHQRVSESPVSLQSDYSKTKSDTFLPSVYASELTKKYIQQSKNKEEAQTNIWSSLQIKLKEKDELIKKKRLENGMT